MMSFSSTQLTPIHLTPQGLHSGQYHFFLASREPYLLSFLYFKSCSISVFSFFFFFNWFLLMSQGSKTQSQDLFSVYAHPLGKIMQFLTSYDILD